jgi:parallel beta-helix repeat protein
VRAEPAVLAVPDDFSTIQEAINNAVDGDTIFVKAGTYYEHVFVNKSISLQGEDVSTTIIDGNESGNVVYIVRNDVNITGFTIRNSGQASAWSAGIRLDSAPDSQIHSNNITGNNYGVLLYSSSPRVSILDNTIASNEFGVRVVNGGSGYLNVSDNVVMNNRGYGIKLTGSTTGSHNATIANNLIMNNGDGIYLGRNSNYNTISGNNIIMSTHGLYIEYSTKNMIYSNNFVDNERWQAFAHIGYFDSTDGVHVIQPSVNAWDNGYPSGGNYWSDYSGADAYMGFYQNETGSDGIGDTPVIVEERPYPLLPNVDRYPLTAPWTEILGPVGDVNGDGKVDMKDIGYVARRFMCLPGEGLWDPGADLNGDGRINMTDIGIAVVARRALAARHFGEHSS